MDDIELAELTREAILVLDDYHTVHSPEVHNLLIELGSLRFEHLTGSHLAQSNQRLEYSGNRRRNFVSGGF